MEIYVFVCYNIFKSPCMMMIDDEEEKDWMVKSLSRHLQFFGLGKSRFVMVRNGIFLRYFILFSEIFYLFCFFKIFMDSMVMTSLAS